MIKSQRNSSFCVLKALLVSFMFLTELLKLTDFGQMLKGEGNERSVNIFKFSCSSYSFAEDRLMDCVTLGIGNPPIIPSEPFRKYVERFKCVWIEDT